MVNPRGSRSSSTARLEVHPGHPERQALRQINAYFNQLGDGLARRAAPGHLGGLQAAVDRLRGDRRADNIDLEPSTGSSEAAAKAAPRPTRRRRGQRPTRARGQPWASPVRTVVLGVSGGIAAYKAVDVCRRLRRRRGARRPVIPTRAPALRRARPPSPRWRARGPRRGCSTTTTPSRTPGSGRAPTSCAVVPATARVIGRYAAGHLRRPAHRHAAGHPGAGACCARPCTPRCGSTPPCRTTWACLRPRRRAHRARPRGGPPGRRRRRRGPRLAAAEDDRRGARDVLGRRRPRRAWTRWSPRAAPAGADRPGAASSATARRASRATPWPPRRPPRGANVTLVTHRPTGRCPGRHRRRAGRDRGPDGRGRA